MEFNEFLKRRRSELGFSQADVADGLSLRGQETGHARVGHWETGRNKPPLEDSSFREALASVLQMDVNDMMATLGFVTTEDDRSPEARLAASIVDQLPPMGRTLAIDYLQVLQKRFTGQPN